MIFIRSPRIVHIVSTPPSSSRGREAYRASPLRGFGRCGVLSLHVRSGPAGGPVPMIAADQSAGDRARDS
jgi:hypothetical protein